MKTFALWAGIALLVTCAAASVISSAAALLSITPSKISTSAPEDILGWGLLPIWLPISALLGVLMLLARKSLSPVQLAIVAGISILLFVADWVIQARLHAVMGI
jgi:hypothetical protein